MTPATFADFYALGFTRLVPIVPHNAAISDRSSLALRIGTEQDSRGKAVGVKGTNGWYGFDWLPHECDEHDLVRWQAMGAGIGIKTGQGLIGIDADTMNEQHAALIQMTAVKHFGMTPVRIGNYPKALYLVAVSAPIKYTRVEFGELDAKGRLKDRVEILSDGRQFVAHGTHPKTLKPYTWTRPIVARAALPVFSPAQIVAFLEELRTLLPAARPLITEGATTDISQASLRGSIETVRKAVQATPNTSAAFGTREAYRDFGYAIKAALPDNEPEAFDMFADWAARWSDGVNAREVVEADWSRMKPPFRRGANFLYELAEQHNPDAFKKVDAFFDVIEEPAQSLFGVDTATPESPATIKWVDPAEWAGVTPPVRRWRVAGMIPDGEVTLLTGAGGVGKTLLAQQCGTAVAAGLPFLGRATEQCRVMLFLCEDSEDELQLRQRDINATMGLDLIDLSSSLRIASRKFMDNLLAIWNSTSGPMKRTAVWEALRADAVAFGAKLLVVDTIADTFGGNESDRSQVRQFVQACLGRLAQEIGGSVLALGHPSKAGQAVGGDGTSGSTAWHASVRSRLYLQHAAKDGTGPMRRLENRKANYGASGDVFILKWLRGAFALESTKTMALLDDDADEPVDSLAIIPGVAPIRSMGNVIDDAILHAVASAAREGLPLSKASNSPHWAVRHFKRASDALGVYTLDEIEAGWNRVVTAGRVKVAVVGRKANNRMPIVGFEIVPQEPTEMPADVFE